MFYKAKMQAATLVDFGSEKIELMTAPVDIEVVHEWEAMLFVNSPLRIVMLEFTDPDGHLKFGYQMTFEFLEYDLDSLNHVKVALLQSVEDDETAKEFVEAVTTHALNCFKTYGIQDNIFYKLTPNGIHINILPIGLEGNPQNDVRSLPGRKEIVTNPVTKKINSLHEVIMQLNDKQKWTREQIADWLETLDVDLRFPSE